MNVNRNIKVPDLISSIFLLSRTDIGLKRFSQNGYIFVNFVTLKWGLPYISCCNSPTISHRGLILVLYARQITVLSDFIIAG